MTEIKLHFQCGHLRWCVGQFLLLVISLPRNVTQTRWSCCWFCESCLSKICFQCWFWAFWWAVSDFSGFTARRSSWSSWWGRRWPTSTRSLPSSTTYRWYSIPCSSCIISWYQRIVKNSQLSSQASQTLLSPKVVGQAAQQVKQGKELRKNLALSKSVNIAPS